MDIATLLISLLSGVVGGNAAGAAAPDKSLGTLGNSVAGLFGGGIGGYIAQILGLLASAGVSVDSVAHAAQSSGLDIGSILANIGSSGIGGALLTVVIGLIKNSMNKA